MTSRTKYQRPNPLDFYNNGEAKNYELERKGKKTWRAEQEIVENFINQIDIKNVLDVPFGTGRFVPLYLKKQIEIYGVEISSHMIKEARKKFQKDFIKCNVILGSSTNLPFKDNLFDLLVCTRFLTAIITFGDVKKSLREFSRVTKKYLFLEIGHREINVPRLRKPSDDEKMAYWFYPDEIKEMLKKEKIKIIKSKSVLKDLRLYLCEKE